MHIAVFSDYIRPFFSIGIEILYGSDINLAQVK